MCVVILLRKFSLVVSIVFDVWRGLRWGAWVFLGFEAFLLRRLLVGRRVKGCNGKLKTGNKVLFGNVWYMAFEVVSGNMK